MSTTIKKSEFVSAINSFAAAAQSGDSNLMQFSVNLLQSLMQGIEFAPEEEETEAVEEVQEVAS